MSSRSSSAFAAPSARYEIFAEAQGWSWRFVDGLSEVAPASRPLTREQCLKTVQWLRNTLAAPLFILH